MRTYGAALAAVLLSACGPEPSAPEADTTRIDHAAKIALIEGGLLPSVIIVGEEPDPATIEARMALYQTPGASIAFFKDGEVVWSRAYGVAETETGAPVTDETLFQAASISKALTAVATLRLVEEGVLPLDQDVSALLTSWPLPEGAQTAENPVTVRKLLSHTAGVTGHGFAGYPQGAPLPTLIETLDGMPPANQDPIRVAHAPGERFIYSGGGYMILQQVLEDVTGEPFPDLMSRLVFEPAGMTNSVFQTPLADPLRSRAASAHSERNRDLASVWMNYPEYAAAGLWTTPRDLARLGAALLDPGSLLSAERLKEMSTPGLGGWGLGVSARREGDARYFGHGGDNFGFTSRLMIAAHAGEGVAVMTNGDGGLGGLREEILLAVGEAYGWPGIGPERRVLPELEPEKVAGYAGRYREANGFEFDVFSEARDLFILATPLGPDPVRLLPKGDDAFFVLPGDLPFQFFRGGDGAIAGVRIGSREAVRLP